MPSQSEHIHVAGIGAGWLVGFVGMIVGSVREDVGGCGLMGVVVFGNAWKVAKSRIFGSCISVLIFGLGVGYKDIFVSILLLVIALRFGREKMCIYRGSEQWM
jgi:hypothetical protein